MSDRTDFYQSNITTYEQALRSIKKQLFYNAVLRLASFSLLAYFIYKAFVSSQSLYTIAILVLLSIFLALVKRSTTLQTARQLNDNLLFINKNELGIINAQKNQFDDGTSEKSNEAYYDDLDIFGEGSLFELLNRTATIYGKNTLANILKTPQLDRQSILNQQEAIKVFSAQPKQRQMITAGALSEKENQGRLDQLNIWLQQPAVLLNNKWLVIARYLLPAVNVVTLIICLNINTYYLLTITMILSWIHVGFISKYTNQQSILLSKKQEVLHAYATILREYKNVDCSNSNILKHLKQQTNNANTEIKKLAVLVNLLDQRLNILVNIFLNGFLVYDLQCVLALEKWKLYNRTHLNEWIECIGQIESLVSLSTYAFNHSENNYPSISTEKNLIEGTQLYHPLIPREINVSNDVSIGTTAKLLLITGSNMSGKTTYLRTVGINILMAQSGLPVCGASLHFVPVQIFTSIRISDSLQQHTSYFMAELKRLQYIKNNIQTAIPSLVLIDEILRGTNSVDKYHGSEQFVLQLIKYNCLTMFATHDLKLSVLEETNPGLIENYCFESIIENNELNFDYKVLRGVARNKNASFLMKKMGII